MRILGIDPGATGALALIVDGKLTEVVDTPSTGGVVTGKLVRQIASEWEIDRVIIEQVWAQPMNGKFALFKLGRAYGTVIGALCDYVVEFVSPQKWKNHHDLSGKPKDAARLLALEKWPDFAEQFKFKKNVDRADAALVGLWRWEMR